MDELSNAEKAERAKKNLQEIFKKNPTVKQAFRETLEELSKPENVKKQAADICKVLQAVNDLQNIHTR